MHRGMKAKFGRGKEFGENMFIFKKWNFEEILFIYLKVNLKLAAKNVIFVW